MINGFDVHVFAARFPDLHEIDIVLQERSVQYADHAHLMADVTDSQHVFQTDGLAADEVRAGLYAHERHFFGCLFLDGRL